MSAVKRHEGVTLLEVLLVLTIGATIFIFSVRQYYSFRLDADMLSVKSNVDTLFQAAAGYYQANCGKGKLLDPTIAPNPKPINVTTDLINGGYLASTFPTSIPLVDSTGPGSGYVVQFNEYTMPRMQQVCSNPPDCTSPPTSIQVGTIVIWKIQIAVLMKNTSAVQLANAKNYLAADCLSFSAGSPATVALCSTNPTGNYVVFERLPSFAISNPNTQSTFWVSDPFLKQYNQMYTTNPITDLTTQSHTPEYQYSYCSG